jgi:hypothetical protein
MTANPLWSPVLHAAERLRLKMLEGDHEWRSWGGPHLGGRPRIQRALLEPNNHG